MAEFQENQIDAGSKPHSFRGLTLNHFSFFCGIVLLVFVTVTGVRERWAEHDSYLNEIDSNSSNARANAASKLGRFRDPRDIATLQLALTDRSSNVRKSAAKGLHAIKKELGPYHEFLWHIAVLDDELTFKNGKVELTREVEFQVSSSYEDVTELTLFVPEGTERIKSVVDDNGKALPKSLFQKYPLKSLQVSGIRKASTGSVRKITIKAELDDIFAQSPNDNMVRLGYVPGYQMVPVWSHRLKIWLPEAVESIQPHKLLQPYIRNGKVQALTWSGHYRDSREARALRFEIDLPKPSYMKEAPPRQAIDKAVELATAAKVAVLILLLGVAYLGWIYAHYRRSFHLNAIAVASLFGVVVFFQPLLMEDSFSYYSYARSAVLDGDFNFSNEYLLLNSNNYYCYKTQELPSPSGPAVLWAPLIWLGHLAARSLQSVGVPVELHGYSIPYLFTVGIGGYFMTLVSLIVSYRLALRYSTPNAALGATLLVCFGSNLVLVAFAWTGSSFQPSLFLFSLFLYYWHETACRRHWTGWILLGLFGGLLVQVRYQNGLLLILPLAESLYLLWQKVRPWQTRGVFGIVICGVLFLLAAGLGFAPQIAIFMGMQNETLPDSFRLKDHGKFEVGRIPQAVTGMFWYGHSKGVANGYFNSSPVLLAAAVGLFMLLFKSNRRVALICLALLLQILITASYETWYGKLLYVPSFYLTTCTPIFVLGLARFLSWMGGRWYGIALGGAAMLFAVIWNLYNCYLQLVYKQVSPYPDKLPFLDGLHSLFFLPQEKFTNGYAQITGQFGYILRGLSHSLLAENGIEFVISTMQILILIPLIFLAVLMTQSWSENASKARSCIYHALVWMFLGWAAVDFTYQSAKATDMKYSYFRRRLVSNPESPNVLWGKTAMATTRKPIIQNFDTETFGVHKTDLFLIGFLKGATHLEQGSVFGKIKIKDSEGNIYEQDLIVGKHAADIACLSPFHLSSARHGYDNLKVVHDWLLRDETGQYFWGHACACHFYFPERIRPLRITITLLIEDAEYVLTGIRALMPSKEWPANFRSQAITIKKSDINYRERL
ncbi:MAG: glycosyltransferase family 39 protein [Planctomycetota bacterium]|nr:glycosyltransferase family 39 protein [Planctomycetota bacterium]MDA1138257.1 glycosyltransferase family 39 protein [Planctomycetota bacterium]